MRTKLNVRDAGKFSSAVSKLNQGELDTTHGRAYLARASVHDKLEAITGRSRVNATSSVILVYRMGLKNYWIYTG